jgi:hypothetical protein
VSDRQAKHPQGRVALESKGLRCCHLSELESPKHEKILSPGKGEKYSGLEKETIQQRSAAAPGLIEKKRRRWRRSIRIQINS